jgi:hypothetical protein
MNSVPRALLAILCVIACSDAHALPGDEVMSNAYRCSGIADSHQWLDCYYGAAQPLRGALGLQPVTESQARLTAAPPTGGTQQDVAAREEVMAAAARCYVVKDRQAWLDCYYSSAQPLRSLLGLPAIPHLRGVAASQVSTDSGIGMPAQMATPIPATRNSSHVLSPMTSYSFDRDGIFTVKLANGEMWRQLPGDIDYAHWKKPPGAYRVTITSGALHSFNMRVQGSAVSFKVEQVK